MFSSRIEAWLKDRKQRVCVDESLSGWRTVLSPTGLTARTVTVFTRAT